VKILAIDTTSDLGSIAIVEGAHVMEEVVLKSGDGFAHVLFGEIEQLLARHGLTLHDIEGFASASGPGTFTGVRVGLAAVKGLAEALGRKVAAVSNLKAMADFGTRELRAPWIDARRGEIYGAVYSAALKPVRDEVVMKQDAWLASLPEGAVPEGATITVGTRDDDRDAVRAASAGADAAATTTVAAITVPATAATTVPGETKK